MMAKSILVAFVIGLAVASVACLDPDLEEEYRKLRSKIFQHNIAPINFKRLDPIEVLDGLKRLNEIKKHPTLEELIDLADASEEKCADNPLEKLEDVKKLVHHKVHIGEQSGFRQHLADMGIRQFKICEPKYHSNLVDALSRLTEEDKDRLVKIGTIYDDMARSGLYGNPRTEVDYHCTKVVKRLNKVFKETGEKGLVTNNLMLNGAAKAVIAKQFASIKELCDRVDQTCSLAGKPYFDASILFDPKEELFDGLAKKWVFKIKACERINYVMKHGRNCNLVDALRIFNHKRNPLKPHIY